MNNFGELGNIPQFDKPLDGGRTFKHTLPVNQNHTMITLSAEQIHLSSTLGSDPSSPTDTILWRVPAIFHGFLQQFVNGPYPAIDPVPVLYIPGVKRCIVGSSHLGMSMAVGGLKCGDYVLVSGTVPANSALLERSRGMHSAEVRIASGAGGITFS